MQEKIIITGTLDTGTSFGVIPETGDSVFIPASLARQFDMRISDEYTATLAPNAADRRDVTPWRVVKLVGAPVEPDDGLEDDWDDQDVLDILSDHDGSMSADDVAVELFGKAGRHEVRDTTSVLNDLAKKGKITHAVIRLGPLTEVRYSIDPGAFR
jgi:hypothetical protein